MDCGIVSPSAFAVFVLITSSNLVGCSTGRSEALVAMQGAATHTDISWFRDLHEWKVQHGVSAYNDDHALMKATLDEKLRRMHVIAEKLEAKVR